MRASFESWLHGQWQKRSVLSAVLFPFSLLYNQIAQKRACNTEPVSLSVPVVVIGNIFVGGTGKTPVTLEVVKSLHAAGFNPGIVSRGYGRNADTILEVRPDSSPDQCGDEPILISAKTECPVFVGRDRAKAAQALLDAYPEVDVIVTDDGLQHYRLGRDVEIAVIGARGLGNGLVLPAGPLREPVSRLDRVDAIIMNGTDLRVDTPTPQFKAQTTIRTLVNLATGDEIDIDTFARRAQKSVGEVVAAAGIGDPDRFFGMLRQAGISATCLPLSDHFNFAINPFRQSKAEAIILTAKDAVKCRKIPEMTDDDRIWIAELEMQLDEDLIALIIAKIKLAQKRIRQSE